MQTPTSRANKREHEGLWGVVERARAVAPWRLSEAFVAGEVTVGPGDKAQTPSRQCCLTVLRRQETALQTVGNEAFG